MRIDELFNRPVAAHEMDQITPAEAYAQFRVTEAVAAWAFYIDDQPYVVYFTPTSDNRKGWFDCNFAKKVNTKYKNEFNLTGDRVPFKVMRYVLEGIQRFLVKYKPITVQGLGYQRRQSEFYKKLIAAYKNALPEPYFWAQDPDGDDEIVLISRSKNLVPVGQKPPEPEPAPTPVEESADDDMANLQRAEEIAQNFAKWMNAHNESTPFGEIPAVINRSLRGAERLMYVNGSEFGEDEDLNMGFAWHTDGTRVKKEASLMNGRGPAGPVYFIAVSMNEDPSTKTDLIWSVRWPHLIHELTHYLDRKRQKTPEPKNRLNGLTRGAESSNGPDHYYNHPLEFNAYFQQGLHQLLPAVKRGRVNDDTFEAFLKDADSYFDGEFRLNMNERNRQRYVQRLHALYQRLKTAEPE